MTIIEGKSMKEKSQARTVKRCVFVVGALQSIKTKIKDILSSIYESRGTLLLVLKKIDVDLKRFNHVIQIISGTPESLYDMIKRKYLKQKI